MSRPLYQGSQPLKGLDKQTHGGLWWDKFFDRYDDSWSVPTGGNTEWIELFHLSRGSEAQLNKFIPRQVELGLCLHAQQQVFTTEWNFITGMGLSHPVENGFRWHPTLGVPYLPASSVKGLVRSCIEEWQEFQGGEVERQAKIDLWFGVDSGVGTPDAIVRDAIVRDDEETDDEAEADELPTDAELQDASVQRKRSEKAGSLIFFDALPIGPVELATDVMTPHLGKWYEQGGKIDGTSEDAKRLPTDWHSPVPIAFLAVKSASFLFQIAPRPGMEQAQMEANEAMTCLQFALEWLGAGAKTAVGYGRMKPDDKKLARLLASVEKASNKTTRQKPVAVSPTVETKPDSIVSFYEMPRVPVVQVTVETGEVIPCSGFAVADAVAKWDEGVRDFWAGITYHNGVPISAQWQDWG